MLLYCVQFMKNVEMIKSDTTFSGTSPQKLTNYKFNVLRERITFVQGGKRSRKNESNTSDMKKKIIHSWN
jgi:hypothetical protein